MLAILSAHGRAGLAGGPDESSDAAPATSDALQKNLASVRKVFIELLGEETDLQELAKQIEVALGKSGEFLIVDNKDNADAVLKLRTFTGPAGQSSPSKATPKETRALSSSVGSSRTVDVQLVNEDGTVIWPQKNRRGGNRFGGSVDEVSSKITAELEAEHRKAQSGK